MKEYRGISRISVSVLVLVVGILVTGAHAQSFLGGHHTEQYAAPTSWAVSDTLIDGQPWIRAVLTVAPHHHAYSERTSVTATVPSGIRAGETVAPEPEVSFDRFENRDMGKYEGTAVFMIPLTVTAVPVSDTVMVRVSTQACTETTCFFPLAEEIPVVLRQIPEPVPVDSVREEQADTLGALPGDSGALPGDSGTLTDSDGLDLRATLAEGGVFLALGLMFIGGLLTSLTPCVYPLIPLTVAFFGASRTTALKGFLLSVVFVLGMATMYSILGVTAAATGAVFGAIISNPVVIILIAAVFIAFAASMFGAFKIQLPSAWQMKLNSVGGAGPFGSYLAGLVAGVIAAPCTGPVLGAALTYVATTGDVTLGFFAMFTFAVGMGMLFILIGTFSARIVPESGGWLKVIESFFGVVMLVAALYFLKDVVPPLKALMFSGTTALVVSLALVVAGLAAGALHKRFTPALDAMGNPEPAPSATERTRKAVGVVLLVAGVYGLIGVALAPPPQPDWYHDETAALAAARAEGKPVLIDAYADWCVACKELDKYTYSDPAVLAEMERFIPLKLDFTRQSDESGGLVQKYDIVGLPTVIVLSRDGQELPALRMQGFVEPETFLQKLRRVE